MRRLLIAGLFIGVLALSGCGLKGDLYRPALKPPPQSPATQPTRTEAPETGDSEKNEDEEPAAKPPSYFT